MTYLVVGSCRVQRFDELEQVHSSLVESEASLRSKVADLSAMVVCMEGENMYLVSGKSVLEDVRGVLESQVVSLTQENEGLMIQNESLEQDVVDREWEVEVLKVNCSWLLQVGLVHVMEKLLEHPEFTGGISRIRHAAFVVGEESGWANLKAQVDAGTYDPSTSDSRSSHSSVLDDALLAFATMDFASFLGLGNLDIDGVRALCTFDDSEEGLGELGLGTVGGDGDGVGGDGNGGGGGIGAVGDSDGNGNGDGGGVGVVGGGDGDGDGGDVDVVGGGDSDGDGGGVDETI
ncbi:hypothetical protein Lser_V15G42406 [Lactuca serriola]